ncbi:MAG: substrate-binding domain-containing protein [Treponema sp.]|nr:substrate-binding domain-containing protein [Treponema sp.]
MKVLKSLITALLISVSAVVLAAAAGSRDKKNSNDKITVIVRESGSGTRSAFTELFAVSDETVPNSAKTETDTGKVLAAVAADESAVGYISLGSLDKSVRAVTIDGAPSSAATVKNGTYRISRPFSLIVKTTAENSLTADFIRFVLSETGQTLIAQNGYIAAVKNPAYIATAKSGKITIDGSTSVFPIMEKLAGAYRELNSDTDVKVLQSDSSLGIQRAVQGTVDIGTASRTITDTEKSTGIECTVFALDGIAVIVNKKNPVRNLSSEQVRAIYTGRITAWSELIDN